MKEFVLLYDEIVPGVGLCKAGTRYKLIAENSKYLYTDFEVETEYTTEVIVHGFRKTCAIVHNN